LLKRSPNILLIPGTSSVAHLRENVSGAGHRHRWQDHRDQHTIADPERVRRIAAAVLAPE
jgi:aryl-alcohol dehydrogenase-like predicted oxidoreductase